MERLCYNSGNKKGVQWCVLIIFILPKQPFQGQTFCPYTLSFVHSFLFSFFLLKAWSLLEYVDLNWSTTDIFTRGYSLEENWLPPSQKLSIINSYFSIHESLCLPSLLIMRHDLAWAFRCVCICSHNLFHVICASCPAVARMPCVFEVICHYWIL